jgi:rhodanese-related sulfurtransferase
MELSVQEFMHLRQALPVVDVRAEAEYEAGHIPGARNLPLLHNKARQAVGYA